MSTTSSSKRRPKGVRLFARQRMLLELLHAHGGDLGSKDTVGATHRSRRRRLTE